MMDVTTRYMEIELQSPLVASASPLTSTIKSIKRLEKAGIGAVTLPSIFQESFEPNSLRTRFNPDSYLTFLQQVKAEVDVPVLVSLNGTSHGDWLNYSKELQLAGADGIECNVYSGFNAELTAAQVESQLVEMAAQLKRRLSIPVAIKVSPMFSAFLDVVKQLEQVGSDAVVLFGRTPRLDFDVDSLKVCNSWQVGSHSDIGVPLRWLSLLNGRTSLSLAASSGVYDHEDVIKYLLAGADVVTVASALIHNGSDYVSVLLKGLQVWMKQHGIKELAQIKTLLADNDFQHTLATERQSAIITLDGGKE